jgi:hypothetical protein
MQPLTTALLAILLPTLLIILILSSLSTYLFVQIKKARTKSPTTDVFPVVDESPANIIRPPTPIVFHHFLGHQLDDDYFKEPYEYYPNSYLDK